MAGYAQLDNELRAERTIDGMTSAVQSGQWVHRPRLGYLTADVPGGLQPDPDRAELIRLAFEIYAEGDLSAADVLRKVNSLGLKNRNNTSVSPQQFDKMLRNLAYKGTIRVPSWGLEATGQFELSSLKLCSRVYRTGYKAVAGRTESANRILPDPFLCESFYGVSPAVKA
jgi:Recombinase